MGMWYYLASAAGCLTILYSQFVLLHWIIFKRVISNRYSSNAAAAVTAYAVCVAVTGYRNPAYFGLYLPGLAIVLLLAFLRGRKEDRHRTAALGATFR